MSDGRRGKFGEAVIQLEGKLTVVYSSCLVIGNGYLVILALGISTLVSRVRD